MRAFIIAMSGLALGLSIGSVHADELEDAQNESRVALVHLNAARAWLQIEQERLNELPSEGENAIYCNGISNGHVAQYEDRDQGENVEKARRDKLVVKGAAFASCMDKRAAEVGFKRSVVSRLTKELQDSAIVAHEALAREEALEAESEASAAQ